MGPPTTIRWKDLAPSWHLPNQAPGFMRTMRSWVGGPEGYYNSNPGQAVLSNSTCIGHFSMPAGNRQRGLHYHSVTEIYVILRGQVLGWDGYGHSHLAGPLDCVYIPAGVPHGVRAYGEEPVDLIWVHDALEKKGTTVYWKEGMPNPQDESKEEIKMIPFNDLEPDWGESEEPGNLHAQYQWVTGPEGSKVHDPEHAVNNTKVGIGLTTIPEHQSRSVTARVNSELCVIVKGKAVVNFGAENVELGKFDAIYLPEGTSYTIRNHGEEPTYVVWVHEKPSSPG